MSEDNDSDTSSTTTTHGAIQKIPNLEGVKTLERTQFGQTRFRAVLNNYVFAFATTQADVDAFTALEQDPEKTAVLTVCMRPLWKELGVSLVILGLYLSFLVLQGLAYVILMAPRFDSSARCLRINKVESSDVIVWVILDFILVVLAFGQAPLILRSFSKATGGYKTIFLFVRWWLRQQKGFVTLSLLGSVLAFLFSLWIHVLHYIGAIILYALLDLCVLAAPFNRKRQVKVARLLHAVVSASVGSTVMRYIVSYVVAHMCPGQETVHVIPKFLVDPDNVNDDVLFWLKNINEGVTLAWLLQALRLALRKAQKPLFTSCDFSRVIHHPGVASRDHEGAESWLRTHPTRVVSDNHAA